MKQNQNFQNISKRYLFQEISDRVRAFKENNPESKLLSLGIGDTTQALCPVIVEAMQKAVFDQGQTDTYSGYGPEQGHLLLRQKISQVFYHNQIDPDEIFINDGAKCDLGRLQILFGQEAKIAMQDPTYPVYLDTSRIFRNTPIKTLACLPENDFMPCLDDAKNVDILFLCAPNNPTGTTFSYDQLQKIVDYATKNNITIIYDAAYAFFVQEGPKSIYEIAGTKSIAIELGSFSKLAGFSGVRLGWTVVSKEMRYANGGSVHADWSRIATTFFNGASIIAQKGGIAALSTDGLQEIQKQTRVYLNNIQHLKKTLLQLGLEVYGGEHIPYAWVRQKEATSWQLFDALLDNTQIVTTPGVGFGPSGEGFIRISGFAKNEDVIEASKRLESYFLSIL